MHKRVLVADDHPVVRHGIRSLLEATPALDLTVTEAETGSEAIQRIVQEQPDIVILDYWLPLIDGLEVARQARTSGSNVEIIMYTMNDSEGLAEECFHLGVKALLLKSESGQLVSAVAAATAHSGARRRPQGGLDRCFRPAEDSLTQRERTVIQLVSEEHSNKEMARILNLSVKTIETHRASAMHKLGVKSIADLVRYAIKKRLVLP